MKYLGLLVCLAMFSVAAIAPIGVKELTTQLNQVMENWDTQADNYEYNYDTDNTWLDVGFRSKYAFMKEYLSIETLQALAGEKVFLSGPHGENPNFESDNEFGHYNPAFIQMIHKSLESILDNEELLPKAQKLYENHLKTLARAYYISSIRIDDSRDWQGKSWSRTDIITTYQDILNGEESNYGNGSDFLGEVYRTHADEMNGEEYDWYEANTAPGFWIRRSIDGTDTQFQKLLKFVLIKLDPEFEL